MKALISYGYYDFELKKYNYDMFLMENYSKSGYLKWWAVNRDKHPDFHVLYKEIFDNEEKDK
jgi:hypothetical protein